MFRLLDPTETSFDGDSTQPPKAKRPTEETQKANNIKEGQMENRTVDVDD